MFDFMLHPRAIGARFEVYVNEIDGAVLPVLLIKGAIEEDGPFFGAIVVDDARDGQIERAGRRIKMNAATSGNAPARRKISRDENGLAFWQNVTGSRRVAIFYRARRALQKPVHLNRN